MYVKKIIRYVPEDLNLKLHRCGKLHLALNIYRVLQEERTKLREGVLYVKVYRYNPKPLYPKLNGYGDNGKRSLKF